MMMMTQVSISAQGCVKYGHNIMDKTMYRWGNG